MIISAQIKVNKYCVVCFNLDHSNYNFRSILCSALMKSHLLPPVVVLPPVRERTCIDQNKGVKTAQI